MRTILLVIFLVSLPGCLATSKHVDKGDMLVYKIAKEANVSPALQDEIRSHVEEGSAVRLPNVPAGSPLETMLAGGGGIMALLYGLYKSYQSRQSDKLANRLAFMDKEDSMKELMKKKGV